MNSKIFAALIGASSVQAFRAVGSGDEHDEPVACHELPGTHVTCGSHCFPNCGDTPSDGSHPHAMDYNHYLVIPEARSCYIDTITYGRFDAFLSINSHLNVTMDTYSYDDGLCQLNTTGAIMPAGAHEGDGYCQMFLNVEMDVCNGCADYQRRIEIYSNKDTGCGVEFLQQEEEEEEEKEEEEEEEQNSGDDTADEGSSGGDEADVVAPPIEGDSASKTIVGSAAILAASILALY